MMFLRKLLFAVMTVTLLGGVAVAGEIAPGLQAQLEQVDDSTPVKALSLHA